MATDKDEGDFTRRAGTGMTIIAWLIFLFILYMAFNKLIDKRVNPNQEVMTAQYGDRPEITLIRNPYGHYVATGQINGRDAVFLLDTGATDVAVPEDLADRLGLVKGPPVVVRTANGNVQAYRTRIDTVSLGGIERDDVNATILTNMHGENVLLGMSFLKHFELIQKGNTLTIR